MEIYCKREIKGRDMYMNHPRMRKLIIDSGVENLARIYTGVKNISQFYQEYSRRVLIYLEIQSFTNQ